MKYVRPPFSLALLLALAGCAEALDSTSGMSAKMRVSGGQFTASPFPVAMLEGEDAGALADAPTTMEDAGLVAPPEVHNISSPNNTVPVGAGYKGISALVSPNARTMAIGLANDSGYWIVPVGSPSIENAPDFEVTATLAFDSALRPGPTKLWLAAADEHGHFGPGRALDLELADPTPTGPLVVALSWSADMDLDLIVKSPDGSTLNPKAYYAADGKRVAAGEGVPHIDFDSNIGCLIDGRRQENALFTDVPSGTYEVYVRAASACGLPSAGWHVKVLRDGEKQGEVSGVTYAWELDAPHGGPEGPGRFAFRFHVGD